MSDPTTAAVEQWVGTGLGRLYVRDVGRGVPIIIVHGGPDFDHEYLLPEMDGLAESCRLVYYDQRGRGRSYAGQTADDVSLDSEMEDIDRIREHFGLDTVAVVGHSWGGLLAMEYAIRRPGHVSHLVLMNTAPASHAGVIAFRAALKRSRSLEESERMSTLRADPRHQAGDIDTDLDLYRIHFGATGRDPALLERLVPRLRRAFTAESVVAARAIEDRLYAQTWDAESYDLTPQLARLHIPSLIMHGEHDLVPVDLARELANAIPRSRFIVLAGCGHFAYLEQPDRVCRSIRDFLAMA